ncbi:C-type lectin domain family 2 member D11-like [Microtus oregoni]|uniref:C-type lectin domain family 2 member D11-like n=1 Tax=Microtus oregoni TaxID=111838 RepID=UPI001BB1779F|nr:C-type lectin domain family 2 member D11-like [Microtus oregoni]
MSAAGPAEASVGMLSTTDSLKEGELGKSLKRKYLRIISHVHPAKLYCCYAVIIILTVAVIVLSVALSVVERSQQQASTKETYAACPRNWIGVRNKCFYFSEDSSTWTLSQKFCLEQKAQLARFDNIEELNFLKRYKGTSDYWIGLHRESPEHPWRWMDDTEYNNSVPIRGVEDYAYLNNNGISSARIYADRRWICSKPHSYILQCQIPFVSF